MLVNLKINKKKITWITDKNQTQSSYMFEHVVLVSNDATTLGTNNQWHTH